MERKSYKRSWLRLHGWSRDRSTLLSNQEEKLGLLVGGREGEEEDEEEVGEGKKFGKKLGIR